MGSCFIKGINFGCLRLKLSKSGIFYSYPMKYFRISTGPRGTCSTTNSDGFYYEEQPPNVETDEADQLMESSSEKALSEINNRKSRIPLAPVIAGVVAVVALVLISSGAMLALILVSLVGVAVALMARRLDHQRRSTSLSYELGGEPARRFSSMQEVCQMLSKSHRIWKVESQQGTWDWKRNAGASSLFTRREVAVGHLAPPYIETNVDIWGIDVDRELKLYFFPDRVFVLKDRQYEAVSYESLFLDCSPSRFIEDGLVPQDAVIVGHTWKYIRKDGGPDRRFSDNRQLTIALYSVLVLRSTTGLNIQLQVSNPRVAEQFAAFFTRREQKTHQESSRESAGSGDRRTVSHKPVANEEAACKMLGVTASSTMEEITAAYRKIAQMYHPDKVATLAPEFRELAERRMKEINEAYETLKKRR